MIISFGNPVYDYIKTPVITTGERVLSGGSTNGCLVLQRLGHRVGLVGCIGDDYYERFVADIQRYGIQQFVRRCAQTGGFRLIYDATGNRSLDVLGIADPIMYIPDEIGSAAAVIIAPILQETSVALIQAIHTQTTSKLFLDPQGLMRRVDGKGRIEHYVPQDFASIAPLCSVIKANEVEAQVLTGIDPRQDGAEALRRLKAFGCAIAIITLAEAGSLIDDGQQHYRIPPYVTDARDPTGAGDTYLAGFLHSYLQNPHDLYQAGCYGSATASIWIEHTGPDAPIQRAEVERRARTLIGTID
jgi:sugar/nucleoside kinase (ribokinase family)